MKTMIQKIFNSGNYPTNVSAALFILRMVLGTFMLTHGYGKFMMLFEEGPIRFADPIGIGETASLFLAVLVEFFCSIFLIFGFATRLAVIPLLITMLVAGFIVHAPDPFLRKELPFFYATSYVVILLTGAGKFSADRWIDRKWKK